MEREFHCGCGIVYSYNQPDQTPPFPRNYYLVRNSRDSVFVFLGTRTLFNIYFPFPLNSKGWVVWWMMVNVRKNNWISTAEKFSRKKGNKMRICRVAVWKLWRIWGRVDLFQLLGVNLDYDYQLDSYKVKVPGAWKIPNKNNISCSLSFPSPLFSIAFLFFLLRRKPENWWSDDERARRWRRRTHSDTKDGGDYSM